MLPAVLMDLRHQQRLDEILRGAATTRGTLLNFTEKKAQVR